MTITPDALRADLAGLSGAAAKTRDIDNDMTRAAADRRQWVSTRLEALAPTANTVEADGLEYQALIAERGQLDTVFPA